MAVTQWKPVSWTPNEPITDTKLNQMVSNEEYLHNKMMTGRYSAAGINSDVNVKVIAGTAYIAASNTWWSRIVNVSFSNMFSSGCRPIVTTGVYSTSSRYLMATVQAPSGNAAVPDTNGCRITLAFWRPTGKPILTASYVAYHAIGY